MAARYTLVDLKTLLTKKNHRNELITMCMAITKQAEYQIFTTVQNFIYWKQFIDTYVSMFITQSMVDIDFDLGYLCLSLLWYTLGQAIMGSP